MYIDKKGKSIMSNSSISSINIVNLSDGAVKKMKKDLNKLMEYTPEKPVNLDNMSPNEKHNRNLYQTWSG